MRRPAQLAVQRLGGDKRAVGHYGHPRHGCAASYAFRHDGQFWADQDKTKVCGTSPTATAAPADAATLGELFLSGCAAGRTRFAALVPVPGCADVGLAEVGLSSSSWSASQRIAPVTTRLAIAAARGGIRDRRWLTADSFRGCAFINSVNEIGAELPEVHAITARHKAEMVAVINATLPPGTNRTRTAQALGLAIDGAIVQAQYQGDATSAVKALAMIASTLRQANQWRPDIIRAHNDTGYEYRAVVSWAWFRILASPW